MVLRYCGNMPFLSDAEIMISYNDRKVADLCAQSGERGMLAADPFPFIRQLFNPR